MEPVSVSIQLNNTEILQLQTIITMSMELYPIIYDLSMWSKHYLDMEFHPLSEEWYKDTHKVAREKVIEDTIQKYKDFKEKLLMIS